MNFAPRLALSLPLLVGLALAQEPTPDVKQEKEPPRGERQEGPVPSPQRKLDMQRAGGNEADAAGLDGGGVASSAGGEMISNACSVVSMGSPARIAPGETGTLTILLAMQSHAVIVPGSQLQLNYEPTQGEISLGTWELKPPPLGSLEPKFKGQPVYENTAQIEIPIRVAGGAPHQKHRVKALVEVNLTDGNTGNPLGAFRAEAAAEANVGPSLPKPPVRFVPRTAPANPAAATAGESASRPAPGAQGKVSQLPTDPASGSAARLAAAQDKPEGTGAADLGPAEEADHGPADLPILPIGMGLLGLLALLALLASRKR